MINVEEILIGWMFVSIYNPSKIREAEECRRTRRTAGVSATMANEMKRFSSHRSYLISQSKDTDVKIERREGKVTVNVLHETGRDAVLQRNRALSPNPQRRRTIK